MELTRRRALMLVALVICTGFASWSWFRPYAWRPDPAARSKVVGTDVRRDHSNFWVDIHLKMTPGKTHDLMKPVRLVTSGGREIEPADTTLGGDPRSGTTDLWFKFWLEAEDLGESLRLRINDGSLEIKAGAGMPRLGRKDRRYFPTRHW